MRDKDLVDFVRLLVRLVEEDVLELEVPVHDPPLVHVIHRRENLFTVLNLRTTSSQKCAAVPMRARM